jgi:hypothetical protein
MKCSRFKTALVEWPDMVLLELRAYLSLLYTQDWQRKARSMGYRLSLALDSSAL